jgi:hypothetical protein
MANGPHTCTFCRCRFPTVPPQIDEMMRNAQRVVTELVNVKRELRALRLEYAIPQETRSEER